MERSIDINLRVWPSRRALRTGGNTKLFALSVIVWAGAAAVLAGWLPLQISIVTVFLFAGPHNWFEFRYFLMRLPVRFGKSRNFFLAAFSGIELLTITFVALPLVYTSGPWTSEHWPLVIATWNSLLLGWLGLLVWLRGKNKPGRNWFWAVPVAFALGSVNWMAPEFFSLAIVYVH